VNAKVWARGKKMAGNGRTGRINYEEKDKTTMLRRKIIRKTKGGVRRQEKGVGEKLKKWRSVRNWVTVGMRRGPEKTEELVSNHCLF